MKNRSIWAARFTTPELLLLLATIGINYIGKLLIQLLALPLWLDSIGTFLACILGGPIIGMISGLINNLIYGFLLDPISFFYGLTSVAMALAAGIMARKGFFLNWRKVLLMGILTAVVAAIVSTPINLVFWEGTSGNKWGDMLFNMAKSDLPIEAASFVAELAVDLPDKILTAFISYAIYRSLPKSILQFYEQD